MSLNGNNLGHITFSCVTLIIESSVSCNVNSMSLNTVGFEYVQHISA